MRISRTALSCLLRPKGYGTYPAGAAFGAGRDQPPETGPGQMLVQVGFVDLPRTLDRLWGNFPSYDAIGRLEAPMDFMNSVGVLLPMELWGRCVLYSCLNASHFTWASANDKNQF